MWFGLVCTQLAFSVLGVVTHACAVWIMLGLDNGHYTHMKIERLRRTEYGVVEDGQTQRHTPLEFIHMYIVRRHVCVGLEFGFFWPLFLPTMVQHMLAIITHGFHTVHTPLLRENLVIHDEGVDVLTQIHVYDRNGWLIPIYKDTAVNQAK